MLFPVACKIEELCSQEKTKYNLGKPYLSIKRGPRAKLVATDGYGLVAISVAFDPSDVEGEIPIAAIKLARKNASRNTSLGEIRCEKETCVVMTSKGEVSFRRKQKVLFPEYESVIPSYEGNKSLTNDPVKFNPFLLNKIVKACGLESNEGLELIFQDTLSPIIIKCDRPGVNAIMMPRKF